MRTLAVIVLFYTFLPFSNAQSFWAEVKPGALEFPESAKLEIYPSHFRTLELDLEGLKQFLTAAPLEFSKEAKKGGVVVELPFPDGRMEAFRAVESPVMKPGLAARFPMIRTFSAVSADGKPYSARFDHTVQGFHAVIRTDEGTIYIDPFAGGQTQYYISYYLRDYDLSGLDIGPLGCGWEPGQDDQSPEPKEETTGGRGPGSPEQTPVELRVYDMALACTGEYGQAKGGTVDLVLSSFNTAVNRVNEIVTPEAGFKFELIDQTDQLIFLDPATDPYTNADVGGDLLGQNTSVINSIVGISTYDIGHVFTTGCVDVGGVAGGTVCSQGKARGVTCHFVSSVTFIAEQIMAHELAHQFSAGHTWSNCPGILEQLASDSAFEPGSGSTMMSYAGSCGSENIQFGSDTYYHVRSLLQMKNFITTGGGSTCATVLPTDNNEPELEWPYTNGFYIPVSTPFELKATATDPDGDPLTYCWEEYDLGPVATLGEPINNSPIFRSFPPTTASHRTFPRLPAILGGLSELSEVLPTYSRNLTFRCTVRDNFPLSGGTIWKEVKFKSTESAGPFLVSWPNSPGVQLPGGSYQTITWDVANTDQAPVNCQTVNIRLSADGGLTYPYTLLSAAPNTGTAVVAIPNITASYARIRVEAADNVFFDISDFNFQITAPTEPGFIFAVNSPLTQRVCIPGAIEINFGSESILGYDSLLTLDLQGEFPPDAVASFSDTQLLPGESGSLSLDFNQLTTNYDLDLSIRVIAAGGDTLYFPFLIHLVYSDFSFLTMDSPANGASGLNINEANFVWSDLAQAETYDFQIAASPSFSEGSMIHDISGLTANTYSPPVVLEKNELYFWRIRAGNECTQSEFLPPFAFHTISLACEGFMSNDVPVGIPSTGTPTQTSEIDILQEGVITDLNVINLKGYHDGIQQLEVSLRGPDGEQIEIFGEFCGNVTPFNLDLDDESPLLPPCPPNTGQAYQPKEALSVFDGRTTNGKWTLLLRVTDIGGNGGLLETWGLEFCASFSPKNPYISNNNLLLVQPAGTRLIENETLLVQDDDNTADELLYTIVAPPKHGTLVWYGNDLEAGGNFRQISINAGNVWYVHSGDGSETDSFSFVVEDGTGGWLGITTFQIQTDPNAPIATKELPAAEPLRIFPNPSAGMVRVELPETGESLVRLVNAQGQVVLFRQMEIAQGALDLDLTALTAGIYWMQVQTANRRYSGRIAIN